MSSRFFNRNVNGGEPDSHQAISKIGRNGSHGRYALWCPATSRVCHSRSIGEYIPSPQNIIDVSKYCDFQGDLAKKKIYPTLWWLFRDNLLPKTTTFVGYARSKMTVNELRQQCDKWMNVKPGEQDKYEKFWSNNYYTSGNYDSNDDFQRLDNLLKKHEEKAPAANRLFYLALPPSVFEPVTVHIRSTCMGDKYVDSRVLIL